MQIISSLSNVSEEILDKIKSSNQVVPCFLTIKFLEVAFKNKLGYLIVDEKQDCDYAFFLDLGKFYNYNKSMSVFFEKNFLKTHPKLEQYIKKEVVKVVPNTFLCISNIEFNDWFTENSIIKTMLDAHPCYNIFLLSSSDISQEEIDESNAQREYNFKSKVWVDQENWYHDFILKNEIEANIFGYTIARYPDLLEIYDDYRTQFIPMILPLNNPLESKLEYSGKGIEIELNGFEAKDNIYFTSSIGAKTKALLYESVDFFSFYDMELSLNLFNVFEGVRIYSINDQTYQSLFFYTYNKDNDNNKFELDLKNSDENKVYEDKMISDIYTVVPIRYENIDILQSKKAKTNNFIVNNILTGLSFQENYEFGNDSANIVKNSDRIERIDLGTVQIMLTEEPHYNYYQKTPTCVIADYPVQVRLVAAVDKETHTGVLYLLNLGVKVKPTKYLDEITRNGLALKVDENDKYFDNIKKITADDGTIIANLYSYLEAKYKINRVGVPRNLILSPFLSDGDNSPNPEVQETIKQMKSSLLYGEAMFEDGEELGKIVDSSLESTFKDKYGASIYDYNVMNISKIGILQYSDTYKDYLAERIDFAVVNLYYLELLQLEESAIQNANMSISNFVKGYKLNDKSIKSKNHDASSKLVLDRLEEIQEEYTKTLDFWESQTNYYSSNVVLTKLRSTFEIEKDVQRLKRNHKEIQQIYDNRQQNVTSRNGIILSIVGIVLTLLNVLDIYTKAVGDPNEVRYLSAFEKILFENISTINVIRLALLVIFVYYLIKFIGKYLFARRQDYS